ncbi:hypothetical protein HN51_035171 [Arachis hypogaea]|nr:Glycosyltransferase [Arachis hypogaea]
MHSKSGSNFQAFSVNTFPPRTTLSLHSLPLCEQLLLLFCFSLVAKLVAQLALRRRHLNFEVLLLSMLPQLQYSEMPSFFFNHEEDPDFLQMLRDQFSNIEKS